MDKIKMPRGLEFVEINESDLSRIRVEGREVKGEARLLKEIIPLTYQNRVMTEHFDYNLPVYFMFRDVCRREDEEKIARARLRYDITIMLNLKLGLELNKTAGHYHPLVPSTNLSYPELYEVIDGNAYFLLQEVDTDRVINAFIISAERGDKVIVPPNYGHVTVNAGIKPLVIANWVCREISGIYQPYIERRGAVYYITKRFGEVDVVKNEAYVDIPEPRFVKSKANKLLGLEKEESMYTLVERLEGLKWLVEPERHLEMFEESVIFEIVDDGGGGQKLNSAFDLNSP